MMKGVNLRINELKGNIYNVINESQLETGIVKMVLNEILADVTQANIHAVRSELEDFMKEHKESKGEVNEDGETKAEC